EQASGRRTATGSICTTKQKQTATLLPKRKVMRVGGRYNHDDRGLSSTELYDPASGTWTATGSLGTGRLRHTATLLPNGKVLVAGGTTDGHQSLSSTELYDPARDVDGDRQPGHRTRPTPGDAAAQWQGAGGWRKQWPRLEQRRAV